MEIDVAGILCYTKNGIDAFPQTVRKGFAVWGNEKERVISMKKTKRILSSLMALTLSAAMIGLSPVSAQEDATVGNSASSLAQMPESKDTTQNALDLLEEALQKDPNPDLARERLCEDLGVSTLTEENPIKVHPNIIYSTFCGSRMFLFSVSPLSRNL